MIKPSISNDFNRYYANVLLYIIFGISIGTLILMLDGVWNKWFVVLLGTIFFSVFCLLIRSIIKGLTALLILSLSINMDISIGYKEILPYVYPGLLINLTSIVLIFIYIVWAVKLTLNHDSIYFPKHLMIIYGLFVVISISSVFIAVHPEYVLSQIVGLISAYLVFLFASNFLQSTKDIKYLMIIISLMVMLNGIIGITQYYFKDSLNLMFLGGPGKLLIQDYGNINLNRVSGLLISGNNLAIFLNGFLPVLLLYVFASETYGVRILCFVSFMVGVSTLIITFSRGGWVATIISLLFIMFLLMKSPVKILNKRNAAQLVIISLFILLISVSFLAQITTRIVRGDEGSAYSRITLAKTAVKIIAANPITGVGLGNYVPYVLDHNLDPTFDDNGTLLPVHNMFLYIASEIGLPALLLFLWVSILFFKTGVPSISSLNMQKSIFAIGIVGGLAGIYLHSMVENIFVGHPLFVFISYLGGCLVGLKNI